MWPSTLGQETHQVNYSVAQIQEDRAPFGSYRYTIFRGDEAFAIFRHNYRGECEGLTVLASGRELEVPCGMVSDFLTGGGPLPLGLSDEAQKFLETLGA